MVVTSLAAAGNVNLHFNDVRVFRKTRRSVLKSKFTTLVLKPLQVATIPETDEVFRSYVSGDIFKLRTASPPIITATVPSLRSAAIPANTPPLRPYPETIVFVPPN